MRRPGGGGLILRVWNVTDIASGWNPLTHNMLESFLAGRAGAGPTQGRPRPAGGPAPGIPARRSGPWVGPHGPPGPVTVGPGPQTHKMLWSYDVNY